MYDLTYLKGLLDLARSNSVYSIKMTGLEIAFGATPIVLEEVQASIPAVDPLEGLRKQEESLPPDLRADDLMNADKVLFYSSPGHTEAMPLTSPEPEELTL